MSTLRERGNPRANWQMDERTGNRQHRGRLGNNNFLRWRRNGKRADVGVVRPAVVRPPHVRTHAEPGLRDPRYWRFYQLSAVKWELQSCRSIVLCKTGLDDRCVPPPAGGGIRHTRRTRPRVGPSRDFR